MKLSIIALLLTLIFLSACGGEKAEPDKTLVAEEQKAIQDTGQPVHKRDIMAQKTDSTNVIDFAPDHIEMPRPGVISRYDKTVRKYARRYLFDWRLISAQIYTESRFRYTARSYRGALGLMQIMPGTARWLEEKASKKTPELGGVSQMLLDPEMNIHLGCYYDAMLSSRIKDSASKDDQRKMMFAAYNAGPTNLNRARAKSDDSDSWGGIREHLPGETKNYIPRIYDRYEIYKKWAVLKPY